MGGTWGPTKNALETRQLTKPSSHLEWFLLVLPSAKPGLLPEGYGSPFFSTIVLFKHQPFFQVSRDWKTPGKHGEGTPENVTTSDLGKTEVSEPLTKDRRVCLKWEMAGFCFGFPLNTHIRCRVPTVQKCGTKAFVHSRGVFSLFPGKTLFGCCLGFFKRGTQGNGQIWDFPHCKTNPDTFAK